MDAKIKYYYVVFMVGQVIESCVCLNEDGEFPLCWFTKEKEREHREFVTVLNWIEINKEDYESYNKL